MPDLADSLVQLQNLRDRGVISEEDFAQEKGKLLLAWRQEVLSQGSSDGATGNRTLPQPSPPVPAPSSPAPLAPAPLSPAPSSQATQQPETASLVTELEDSSGRDAPSQHSEAASDSSAEPPSSSEPALHQAVRALLHEGGGGVVIGRHVIGGRRGKAVRHCRRAGMSIAEASALIQEIDAKHPAPLRGFHWTPYVFKTHAVELPDGMTPEQAMAGIEAAVAEWPWTRVRAGSETGNELILESVPPTRTAMRTVGGLLMAGVRVKVAGHGLEVSPWATMGSHLAIGGAVLLSVWTVLMAVVWAGLLIMRHFETRDRLKTVASALGSALASGAKR